MQFLTIEKEKSLFTRECIGQAVASLLEDRELKLVKVLDVVRKAGVSRMTFYKYYSSPKSALEGYLQILIAQYLDECVQNNQTEFLSYPHILYALQFFDRYRTFFITMVKRGLYSILINSVNHFVENNILADKHISVYKRYSYAGSLLNCFIMWEMNGKQESVEDVARTIYELYGVSPE